MSERDLYKAKAEHFEAEANRLRMELIVSQEKTAHLERVTLQLSRQMELADRMLEQRDKDLM